MELISILIALAALIVSGVATWKSCSAMKIANNFSKGQVEMKIRSMISTARTNYRNLTIQISSDETNEY